MGPFQTECEASAAARAAAGEPEHPTAVANGRLLWRELGSAGVEMGAYDQKVVEWLAKWEPATVAVIAGWVNRAAVRQNGTDEGERE